MLALLLDVMLDYKNVFCMQPLGMYGMKWEFRWEIQSTGKLCEKYVKNRKHINSRDITIYIRSITRGLRPVSRLSPGTVLRVGSWMEKCLCRGYMEDRNTKGTRNTKGFRVELVVDFTDYSGVENVGRLNDVCWRNLDVCVVHCNNCFFGGIEFEEDFEKSFKKRQLWVRPIYGTTEE